MHRRDLLKTALASALGTGTFARSHAQSGAARVIRLVIPSAPGSAIDPYARVISDHMGRTLARTIIVEAKPGASGNIAAQFVLGAPADGNTIWVATQSATEINPSAYDNPKWSLADFIPLSEGCKRRLCWSLTPACLRRRLPSSSHGSGAIPASSAIRPTAAGTPSHFLGFQMAERFGLDVVHVPSRGSGAQATDLMAGHVLFGFAQLQPSLPLIAAGKLNAIATTGVARSRFLPEVPELRGAWSSGVHRQRLVRPYGPRRDPACGGGRPFERRRTGARRSGGEGKA